MPAHHLVALPAGMSYEEAACLPVAYGTALRMMYTIGQHEGREKVLILGASGGVGTLLRAARQARRLRSDRVPVERGQARALESAGGRHVASITRKQD